jgi:hypothetical protein
MSEWLRFLSLVSLAWSTAAIVILGARSNNVRLGNFLWFALSVAGFADAMGWLR